MKFQLYVIPVISICWQDFLTLAFLWWRGAVALCRGCCCAGCRGCLLAAFGAGLVRLLCRRRQCLQVNVLHSLTVIIIMNLLYNTPQSTIRCSTDQLSYSQSQSQLISTTISKGTTTYFPRSETLVQGKRLEVVI
jgi:hypothetical protein